MSIPLKRWHLAFVGGAAAASYVAISVTSGNSTISNLLNISAQAAPGPIWRMGADGTLSTMAASVRGRHVAITAACAGDTHGTVDLEVKLLNRGPDFEVTEKVEDFDRYPYDYIGIHDLDHDAIVKKVVAAEVDAFVSVDGREPGAVAAPLPLQRPRNMRVNAITLAVRAGYLARGHMLSLTLPIAGDAAAIVTLPAEGIFQNFLNRCDPNLQAALAAGDAADKMFKGIYVSQQGKLDFRRGVAIMTSSDPLYEDRKLYLPFARNGDILTLNFPFSKPERVRIMADGTLVELGSGAVWRPIGGSGASQQRNVP